MSRYLGISQRVDWEVVIYAVSPTCLSQVNDGKNLFIVNGWDWFTFCVTFKLVVLSSTELSVV